MKKISIQVKDAAFDRIEKGSQTEVYLPIEPKYTKMFVSENGRKNLLIDKQKGNAHINAVLDAFALGYRLRIDTASIRRVCKKGVLNYKVKGVRISSGNPNWGAEEGQLCYVVLLGEEDGRMNHIDKTLKWAHNLQASCFGSAVGVTIEASVSTSGNKMIFVTTACESLDNYYVLSEDMPTEALFQEWGRLKDDVGKLLAKYGRRINKHGKLLTPK